MKTLTLKTWGIWSILFASACGPPALPWPAAPLLEAGQPALLEDESRAEILKRIAGHYAHFDVVAYEEPMRGAPMRTFIISYGFTDFRIEGDQLIEEDRFCHAEHRINRAGMQSSLSDSATQAITPPSKAVTVRQEDGTWHIHRPPTPSLIGIAGDPTKPLPTDRKKAQFTDPDQDGKPGMTVKIRVNRFISGEVYLARREIFENHMVLMADGSIHGTVVDRSEQLVAGASSRLFDSQANPKQVPDPGLNPIRLIPIPATLTSCEALMARRAEWAPSAPEFLPQKR